MNALRRQGYLLTALSAMLLGGCATTKTAGTTGDPYVLTREEIMGVEGITNLYDVVRRLRPRWLQVRASDRSFGMTTQIAVFQNQTYLGDVEVLGQLQPGMAYQLKYMDGTTAQNSLAGVPPGVHLSGAIILSTRDPGGG
jgi:hypothetical protein